MKKIFALAAIGLAAIATAQTTHMAAEKETAYGISRQYKLSLEEFYTLNPAARTALNIGDVLIVSKNGKPAKTTAVTNVAPAVKAKTKAITTYEVQPKETLYGICKRFGITQQRLQELNPSIATEGLKINQSLNMGKDISGYQTVVNMNDEPETKVETPKVAEKAEAVKTAVKTEAPKVVEKVEAPKIAEKTEAVKTAVKTDAVKVVDKIETPKVAEKATEAVKTAVKNEMPKVVEKAEAKINEKKEAIKDSVKAIEKTPEKKDLPKAEVKIEAPKPVAVEAKPVSVVKTTQSKTPKVFMFLPFGLDDPNYNMEFRKIANEFYAGAKLAVNRHVANGSDVDLVMVDANGTDIFKNKLKSIDFDGADLVVGPFIKSNLKDVLDICKTKNIPVVSPFANAPDLYSYKNLIITDTRTESYVEKIAQEINAVYKNEKIVVVKSSKDQYAEILKDEIIKLQPQANVVMVNSASELQLEKNMMTGQDAAIISVLASNEEKEAEIFSAKIMDFVAKNNACRAFSVYYNPYFESKENKLKSTSLVYLMDRKINQAGENEKQILADYKKLYCKNPSKYSVIGFDVVSDMLQRIVPGTNFFANLETPKTHLATKFEYQALQNNQAFINKGFRVVRLLP